MREGVAAYMPERDPYIVKGGCWCPAEWTIGQMRLVGHTRECRVARAGWEANARRMSAIERARREDAEAGRLLREAAEAVLARGD